MDCSLQKKFTSFCQVQVKSSTVERPSTWTTATGTYIRILQTIFENSFIWRPKRLVTFIGAIQISLSIYLQKKMHTKENWFHVSVDMSGGVGGGCRKLELPGHHYKHSAKSPGKSGGPRSPRAHHGGRKTSTERRHRGRSRDNTEEDTEVVFKKESTSQSSLRHRTTVAQKRRRTTTPSDKVRCRVLPR